MAKRPTGTRTYILSLVNGGKRKITIPAHWKLTFGNVLPYNKLDRRGGSYMPPGDGWESRIVLRIYEGAKENLRACMNDVVSFRDTEVEVEEQGERQEVKTKPHPVPGGKIDVDIEPVPVKEWQKVDF